MRALPLTLTLTLPTLAAPMLAGCGGSDGGLPQLTAAQPATSQSYATLASSLALPDTRITSSELVTEGGLTATGVTTPIPAHCLVKGKMKERTSTVDGAAYAIGFEIRMPVNWNGRFLYQANGGLDGSVVTALGSVSGGAPVAPALVQGFAVLSSDAGHPAATPFFGLDPQARLDYGYQAVGTLTPMAKNLIKGAYGKTPDRSYIAGCSNGGRHAMVAASRWAEQYDGILAGNPGFSLPKAATTQLWKAQQYAKVAGKDASGQKYALNFSMETDHPKIFVTNTTYTESPWSCMTPPHETDLSTLKNRGGKMIFFHGVADGVFSPIDTAQWMDKLQANHGNDAGAFARLFMVPGMNHCSGGPATDQFDMLPPLVAWVEQGKAPDSVTAKARGAGANVVNTEVPSTWSANRTRPLCVYPKVARYNGTGDVESAGSFSCK